MGKLVNTNKVIPVGYQALVSKFSLKTLPHYRSSFILTQGSPYSERENFEEVHYYLKKYFPKDLENPLHHLEFALKHDGLNLEILAGVFKQLDYSLIESYVNDQPTSKLARKIWFLYEFLMEKRLNLDDAKGGSYSLLLDPSEYYTGKVIRSRRHYIDNNLLGNNGFCPIVRRSQKLKNFEEKNLSNTAKEMMQQYDPEIISRAVNYLYVKETMSSYEIEREKPDISRTQRFVEALKRADHTGSLSKEMLIKLQNMIVDSRYANIDYRDFQNYIGSEARLDMNYSLIHYISPRPQDVSKMMDGWFDSLENMITSGVYPIVAAAAAAFGFVFIHPFEDGNGRLHRFIIHYIFARTGFVPKTAIFPVSAVILKELASYDILLESFSKPLLTLIKDYKLSDQGELSVFEETGSYYRYIDYTRFAEYLSECVEKTINTDFKKELNYIVNYDKAKKMLQEIADMPDKKLNQFIQFVLQNSGKLSKKKREDYFSMLKDEEISLMEEIIQANMIQSEIRTHFT